MHVVVQSIDDAFKWLYIQVDPDGSVSEHAYYIKRL